MSANIEFVNTKIGLAAVHRHTDPEFSEIAAKSWYGWIPSAMGNWFQIRMLPDNGRCELCGERLPMNEEIKELYRQALAVGMNEKTLANIEIK